MADFFAGPSRVWSTTSESEWDALADAYRGRGRLPRPFDRIIECARALGCASVVDEADYADADWRSEYSAFWSRRFAITSPLTRRLHFFACSLRDEDLHRLPPEAPYLGYVVLRPVPWGRVGRSVLAVPPVVSDGEELALTTILDEVHLFGVTFQVRGVPFAQQDGEFLRCAHAASWVCHYVAHRKGLVGRATTSELASFSPLGLAPERSLPSGGLSLQQLQAVFSNYGQPAQLFAVDDLPNVSGVEVPEPPTVGEQSPDPSTWDTRLFSIICRYLNSGFPVLIATDDHAFTVVGWFRERGQIRFVACDDQVGPYEVIESPFRDHRLPWRHIMVPLPPKVLLSAEMAEHHAHRAVQSLSTAPIKAWQALAQRLSAGELSLRTQLKSNAEYKQALGAQGRPDPFVRQLRLTPMANWVWVVEVHERKLRAAGKDCVVAEAVWDSTSHDREPINSALSLPLTTRTTSPSTGSSSVNDPFLSPWRSQLR